MSSSTSTFQLPEHILKINGKWIYTNKPVTSYNHQLELALQLLEVETSDTDLDVIAINLEDEQGIFHTKDMENKFYNADKLLCDLDLKLLKRMAAKDLLVALYNNIPPEAQQLIDSGDLDLLIENLETKVLKRRAELTTLFESKEHRTLAKSISLPVIKKLTKTPSTKLKSYVSSDDKKVTRPPLKVNPTIHRFYHKTSGEEKKVLPPLQSLRP